MLDYYNDDSTYEVDYGTIEITYKSYDIQIALYTTDSSKMSFKLLDDNFKILEDSGFIDMCEVNQIDEYNTVYSYSQPVSLITNHRSAIHSYYHPAVVGLSVGDKVYLDFESGRANLLKFVNSIR